MWLLYNRIYIYLKNPLKTWWKARKYFKFPKIYISYSFKNLSYNWFELDISDILWKDKYNTPRHEFSPHINIVLFKKFRLRILFEGDLKYSWIYWETLLDYLYYSNNIKQAIDNNTGWSDSKNNMIDVEKICLKSKYYGKYM